jgi:hypothetical protein
MRFSKLGFLGGTWLALAVASGVPAADPPAAAEAPAVPEAPAATEAAGAGPAAELAPAAAPAPEPEAAADGAPEAASAEPGAPETGSPDAEADAPWELEAEATPALAAASEPALGLLGHDSQGRPGRIHFVAPGDTLWDISAAYLGSAWVWPSIWQDNRGIENPHLIYPGDRIWITDGEMRRISAEEAEEMLARGPAAPEDEPAPPPAAPFPQAEPPAPAIPEARPTFRVGDRESSGLVAAEEMEAAATIVDAVPQHVLLSQGDRVYLGLGEGEVSIGDQFTAFRDQEKVFDPESGRLLGYHVDFLGWLEVEEVHPETSVARIRLSNSEMERGDRVMPREPVPGTIAIQAPPEGLEGRISFFAKSRTQMHQLDYVYLNRGSREGLEAGSPLEVYRPGYRTPDLVRQGSVKVPDLYVASLLVVRVQPETAVAWVVHSERELLVGDHVRGATATAAAR